MSTLDRLTHLIHDKFGVDMATIDPDAPFASYNLDSLTVAELMFEIDDAFHVTVPDEAVHTVTTLRQLATLIDGLPPSDNKA
jgi:acyl carrier protein